MKVHEVKVRITLRHKWLLLIISASHLILRTPLFMPKMCVKIEFG